MLTSAYNRGRIIHKQNELQRSGSYAADYSYKRLNKTAGILRMCKESGNEFYSERKSADGGIL